MTTKDYQKRSPLLIFLSYFGRHKKLFAVDVLCAMGIAAVDLLFPLVTRSALYDMLPDKMYRTFFIVMIVRQQLFLNQDLLSVTIIRLPRLMQHVQQAVTQHISVLVVTNLTQLTTQTRLDTLNR